MKLSMSLLAWYLKGYEPECAVQDDAMLISGMRFLLDEHLKPLPGYVYFGDARYFLSDPRYADAYIIVHRQSHLLFYNCDYEELLNALLSAFDFFTDWERRLLEAASARASLQEMMEIAVEVVENPFIIGSFSGELMAFGNAEMPTGDPYWDYSVKSGKQHPQISNLPFYSEDERLIQELSEQPQLVRNVYPGSAPVLMLYLKQDEEPVACIGILQMDAGQTRKDMQVAPVLSRYLTCAAEFSAQRGSSRSSESIVRNILDGKEEDERQLRQLEEAKTGSAWRLLILRHALNQTQLQKQMMLKSLKRSSQISISLLYEGDVLMIVPETALAPENWKTLENQLSLAYYSIGASMAASRLDTLPVCLQQARFALDCASGQPGLHRCEDFAFSWLLKTLREQKLTLSLLHPALEQLAQYDSRANSALRPTLCAYLNMETNLQNTADALNIHLNTLKYRLRRIREITGLTLKDAEELAYLRLSVWLGQ